MSYHDYQISFGLLLIKNTILNHSYHACEWMRSAETAQSTRCNHRTELRGSRWGHRGHWHATWAHSCGCRWSRLRHVIRRHSRSARTRRDHSSRVTAVHFLQRFEHVSDRSEWCVFFPRFGRQFSVPRLNVLLFHRNRSRGLQKRGWVILVESRRLKEGKTR